MVFPTGGQLIVQTIIAWQHTQSHFICQNATHSLQADLIHPSHSFELVVTKRTTNKTLGLLSHLKIMFPKRLSVERHANPSKDLCLLGQDICECGALLQEVVQFTGFLLSLGWRDGRFLAPKRSLALTFRR